MKPARARREPVRALDQTGDPRGSAHAVMPTVADRLNRERRHTLQAPGFSARPAGRMLPME